MQQYKDQENMIVGYLTFSGGKPDICDVVSLVLGNLVGMIFSSLLSFLTGDKGPFACLGLIFLVFALF